MKGDAIVRIPRAAWKLGMGYALSVDRELREVIGSALEAYVEGEAGRSSSQQGKGKADG